jgi:hypothetical protein
MRLWGSLLAVLALLLLIHSGGAGAEIYRWIDGGGQVHFTDDASLIPAEYLDSVQTRPSSPPLESSPPPAASKKSKRHQSTKSPSPGRLSGGGRAQVVAVVDGDTIVISGGEKVRYTGIGTILHSGLLRDSPSTPPSIAWGRNTCHHLPKLPIGSERRNFTLHLVA